MNQAEMEDSLRALLAERAQRAPLSDGLAEQIITQVAHPSVRDDLRRAGRELGFQV